MSCKLSAAGRADKDILYDAVASADFCKALLGLVRHRRRLRGEQGELEAIRSADLRVLIEESQATEPHLGRLEHNNSLVFFGNKLVLKLFRRLEPGINPELELAEFLSGQGFANSPALAGAIEYSGGNYTRFTLAVASGLVPSSQDGLAYTLDGLSRYYDRAITWVAQSREAPAPPPEPIKLLELQITPEMTESIGTYLESARLLGVRTAELHLALASAPEPAPLAPEPFTPHYQRGLFQTMRNLVARNFKLLRKQMKSLPPDLASLAQRAAELEAVILEVFRSVFEGRITAKCIRIHGHLHLGEALWTGKDFIFIDFEGDPMIPLSERHIKRSPLRDVAGMIRSFHYAAYSGLYQHVERGSIPHENLPKFETWVRLWKFWVSVAYFQAYCHRLGDSGLLPGDESELRSMLRAYLLHEMMRELGWELAKPSARLRIPLEGIATLLSVQARGRSSPPAAPPAAAP